jgi:hypothetical protein
MSRADDDTDTDADMDGLVQVCGSTSSSCSSSPLPGSATSSSQVHEMLRARSLQYKRDEIYYFEDGSCIILIEDTLFNIHRSILSKDSSSFRSLFSLPQGSIDVEGRSDDNPIILTGDTPEEFRHFLWALYALPPELQVATTPSANLGHLIDVAKVANKYSFKSIETWALDAIHVFVNLIPSPILTTSSFSAEPLSQRIAAPVADTAALLTRLIRLAQLCHHDRLLNTMIGLLRQLMTSSVQYAYLAMTLSDELNLRSLRGAAYLEVMQKATVVKKTSLDSVLHPPSSTASTSANAADTASTSDNTSEGSLDTSGRLVITRAQQLRLLAGYYRLTSTWDKLRLTPLAFEHSHTCGATWHQQGCMQSWLEFWKEKTKSDSVMNLGLADVIGRLKLVQKEYDRWGSATYMHHDCRINAKKAITDTIRRVEEALPDYFAEPGGFEED